MLLKVVELLPDIDGGGLLMNVKRQFHIFVVKFALFHIDTVLVYPCVLLLDTLLIYVLLVLSLHTSRARNRLSNKNCSTVSFLFATNLWKFK